MLLLLTMNTAEVTSSKQEHEDYISALEVIAETSAKASVEHARESEINGRNDYARALEAIAEICTDSTREKLLQELDDEVVASANSITYWSGVIKPAMAVWQAEDITAYQGEVADVDEGVDGYFDDSIAQEATLFLAKLGIRRYKMQEFNEEPKMIMKYKHYPPERWNL
jgi:hypothetical protein